MKTLYHLTDNENKVLNIIVNSSPSVLLFPDVEDVIKNQVLAFWDMVSDRLDFKPETVEQGDPENPLEFLAEPNV